MAGDGGIKGDAFVGENDVDRLQAGQRAVFIAGLAEKGAFTCHVDAVDKVNLTTLEEPSVASVYGGTVPAEQDPSSHQLIPLRATWRVRLTACDGASLSGRNVTGVAHLGADRESLLGRGIRFVAAIGQREAGF